MKSGGERTAGTETPSTGAGGFTLTELLIVIAIITLLTSVLVPALQGARKRARGVVCRSHLKQWGTVLALYLEDQEGRFSRAFDPFAGLWLLRDLHITAQTDPNAPGRERAVETRGISCCPMATKTTGDPSLRAMSAGQTYLEISPGGTFPAWEIRKPVPAFRGRATILVGSLDNTDLCINRHDGALNALFLDWSVRPVGKELWTLKWHGDFDTAGPWTKAGGVKRENWPLGMRKLRDYWSFSRSGG